MMLWKILTKSMFSSWTREKRYLRNAATGQNSCWTTARNFINRGVQDPLPNWCSFFKKYHNFREKSHIDFVLTWRAIKAKHRVVKNTELSIHRTESDNTIFLYVGTILSEIGWHLAKMRSRTHAVQWHELWFCTSAAVQLQRVT